MRDLNKLGSPIYWVCFDCGKEALTFPENKGKKQSEVSTVHNRLCDVCHRLQPVTEVRDFGYPTFK
jgi:hypothetical protein